MRTFYTGWVRVGEKPLQIWGCEEKLSSQRSLRKRVSAQREALTTEATEVHRGTLGGLLGARR